MALQPQNEPLVDGEPSVPASTVLDENDDETKPEYSSLDDGVDATVGKAEKSDSSDSTADTDEDHVIRTGADAANHMSPLRDDGDPSLTFRSIVLGTLMSAFQAVMTQIYRFKPTVVSIGGAFIVSILYVSGNAWATLLPRGDKLEAKWRKDHGDEPLPSRVKIAKFVNPGEFGLKEHAVAAITANSASNGIEGIAVFATQNLFYTNKLSALNVILSTLSIGSFGYGSTGSYRPVTVYSVESVFWSSLPIVTAIQSLHWDNFREHTRLRWFWYSFAGMSSYEIIPGYIFPWLNSVSIPCLASMKATGAKAQVSTNLFGGALSNEGLGILNFSFDWQYITSFSTSLHLTQQGNAFFGYMICWFAFLGVYYTNTWGAKSHPFSSTRLQRPGGGTYNSTSVFNEGHSNQAASEAYGSPEVTGTYAWAMLVGNCCIGALIAHCVLFWGPDIVKTVKGVRKGESPDRHYIAMKKYKEANWWWYATILVIAFVLGIIVTAKEDIGIPVWAYIVASLLGAVIAPFSTILYARFGNGVATNQSCKMIAGVVIPGRPLGNLYFSAWSHSTIAQSLNSAQDLKMGSYLKVPPRVMFLTQIYGTVLGAFLNYVVMISIVNSHRDLLISGNGSYAWSGQYFQSLNTQATTWALSKYLYGSDGKYSSIPIGLGIGAAFVVLHRIVYHFLPKIGRFHSTDSNLPVILTYSGYSGFNQTQSCTVLSSFAAGFFVQYYLRNYRPRIFQNYSYLVTAAFDGGSLLTMFILSFAVFGAAGKGHAFPIWWGNSDGYPDHCPVAE